MSSRTLNAVAVLFSLFAASALAEPLRIVQDPARNRTWLLERNAVTLRESTHQKRFVLFDWVRVGETYACRPDLAIDGRGRALVSSNAVSVVWRIDPEKPSASKHELLLDADSGKDIGFTGLAYAPDQDVFFAVSANHGSLWRIDPLLRRAQKIELSEPLRDACGLSVERSKTRRTLVLCVRGLPEPRRVHFAPDQRSAYVRREACLEHAADADIALAK